ncbi:MAG TPA: MgtC/SapB family protein, partial [Sphingomicrobium sp.]|nr:MgtC/SapB family protein [Sphingomicrobium sp.]
MTSMQALSLMTALACGLLIGIERGFTLRREREGSRVAGVRTFTLLGLVSGLAGFLGSLGQQLTAGALVTAAAAVIAVGYAHRPNLSEHPDATTSVAALATLALGFVSGFGEP